MSVFTKDEATGLRLYNITEQNLWFENELMIILKEEANHFLLSNYKNLNFSKFDKLTITERNLIKINVLEKFLFIDDLFNSTLDIIHHGLLYVNPIGEDYSSCECFLLSSDILIKPIDELKFKVKVVKALLKNPDFKANREKAQRFLDNYNLKKTLEKSLKVNIEVKSNKRKVVKI